MTLERIYKYRLVLILAVVIGGFSVAAPKFLSFTTITNVLWSVALTGIMAAGAIYTIINGGIDLSVGSVAGFTSVLLADFMALRGWSFLVSFLIVIACGLLIGFLNGVLVTKLKIPAFITTMAMLKIVSGIALVYSGGKTTQIMNQPFFLGICTTKLFTVPLPVYIMLGIMCVSYWLLSKSEFGRRTIATGGNKTASELSGIHTDRIVIAGHIISTVCAVLSGIVLSSMTQQGRPTMAQGYEMNVITAIVLGGASLAGGKGSIWGTLFGVVLIGLISAGMTMLNAPTEWHSIVKGLIIIATVSLDVQMSRRTGKGAKTHVKLGKGGTTLETAGH